MKADLDQLIQEAPAMTPEQLQEQRVSFAYGNVALHNPRITREMVRAALKDEEMSSIERIDLLRGYSHQ